MTSTPAHTSRRAPAPTGKAGRNLRAAITVGVALAAVVIASLVIDKRAFLAVLIAAMAVGSWELRRALATRGMVAPLMPLLVGSVAMPLSAFADGPEGLLITFAWVMIGVVLWRVADGVDGAARDISAAALIALYPGFLGSFAALLLAAPDGHRRLIVFILVTVFSDIGGYVVGVLIGKHPMAPSVSPKKSWEGFAGSVLTCAAVGAAAMHYLLSGPLWAGVVLGVMAAAIATIGDLIESSIKRDLGVKDMSDLLPGHGGLMDRLDSLILTLVPVWAVLTIVVPVVGSR